MDNPHWNLYYQNQVRAKTVPSQFAAFMVGEYVQGSQVFDIGCGNGRDTFFFANFTDHVTGVDGSSEAHALCVEQGATSGSSAAFVHAQVESGALGATLAAARQPGTRLLVYSRFFLHAIDDAQEASLFALFQGLCVAPADRIALEFRTLRDRDLPKQTKSHFRRYLDPVNVIMAAARHGFDVDYFVEGFGFAKYGSDDAYVARMILRPRPA